MNSIDAGRHSAAPIRILGRSSSLFTRVPLIFAEELGIRYVIEPIHDMTHMDPKVYGDNPALKLPSLRRGESLLFGAQNICRAVAELSRPAARIVWPEDLCDDVLETCLYLLRERMRAS